MPPTKFTVKTMPPESEIQRLEDDLRARFNAHEMTLVSLYGLAEKYEINDLMNRAIDAIQDGFFEYGTVFGPGLIHKIFQETKKNSQLRELCVGAILIHTDRGCGQLRGELMGACLFNPDVFSVMLRWISRNFHLFGRRQREGYDVRSPTAGFSLLNRKKLCPCHFHTHGSKEAHKNHDKCAVPYNTCGHAGDEDDASDGGSDMIEVDQKMSMLLATLMRGGGGVGSTSTH
jgi:hypothetical protein